MTREEIEKRKEELVRVATHEPEVREEICSLADHLWEMEKKLETH